jgi:two-component system chemotaxis response regulator CheB
VVDDSAVFRRILSESLATDTSIEVVGTAANGTIALTKLSQLKPDLVLLDVEMPVLDGLATLREIRARDARLPVVMFSAHTERGTQETIEALSLGASDYFAKPHGTGSLEDSLRVIREELIPTIKQLCAPKVAVSPSKSVPTPQARANLTQVDVVAIASSTGGPSALTELFAGLTAPLAVPVLCVQHMPPVFTRMLAQRISTQHAIPMQEARDREVVQRGQVWLAPGDYHLRVQAIGENVQTMLDRGEPVNSCRPAADVLLSSLASIYGARVLAVVLTGMGHDALRGCEAVKAAGGQVIAQDEATSVVWGMPGNVVRAGLADRVLPLALIAPEILRRLRVGREDTR